MERIVHVKSVPKPAKKKEQIFSTLGFVTVLP